MQETLRLRLSAEDVGSRAAGEAVAAVAQIWRDGGLVAFPTETVYGLGANALDAAAVAAIFAAKQRPSWDPLIVHVTDRPMLRRVAGELTPTAEALVEAFWPGPLTLLLPRAAAVPPTVTAGRPLVGVRMPAHPVARALIAAAGIPIAAPSANTFGRTSPSTAAHVLEDLDGRIDAIVDGGPTSHGLESTVVDASGAIPVVYRPGVISLEQLRAVAGTVEVYRPDPRESGSSPEALPAPGVGIRHYAPRAKLLLVEAAEARAQQTEFRRVLGECCRRNERPGGRAGTCLGVMLPQGFLGEPLTDESSAMPPEALLFAWGRWEDPAELGRRLFAGLRDLDHRGATEIVCPVPPATGIGAAIGDRLRKAAWRA